jgi:hypothetical protein
MAFDLTAVTGALGVLKTLSGIAKDVNNIEFNQKIIELQQKLLEIQIDYGGLLDENRKLKDEAAASKAVAFHHSVNWKKLEDGSESGPYCPVCYAENSRFMPLEFHGPHMHDQRLLFFECPVKHVKYGEGLNASYLIPKELIPIDRYGERR